MYRSSTCRGRNFERISFSRFYSSPSPMTSSFSPVFPPNLHFHSTYRIEDDRPTYSSLTKPILPLTHLTLEVCGLPGFICRVCVLQLVCVLYSPTLLSLTSSRTRTSSSLRSSCALSYLSQPHVRLYKEYQFC